LSYWLYLFGAVIVVSGFLTPGGAADFGWFAYTLLSHVVRSPGAGADLWIMGLAVAGLGTILGGVNFITTIMCDRPLARRVCVRSATAGSPAGARGS
jgi:cytochrome c oxidase subunit 1